MLFRRAGSFWNQQDKWNKETNFVYTALVLFLNWVGSHGDGLAILSHLQRLGEGNRNIMHWLLGFSLFMATLKVIYLHDFYLPGQQELLPHPPHPVNHEALLIPFLFFFLNLSACLLQYLPTLQTTIPSRDYYGILHCRISPALNLTNISQSVYSSYSSQNIHRIQHASSLPSLKPLSSLHLCWNEMIRWAGEELFKYL